ncbi:DUF456 domain-containing protein [Sabulilitoribacter multivorans]|uniref:DUF456 domain-containing protein n=1 Tax=Flaviramulus multivorans TaxID=1304750 RepID=A0ABS9IGP0_9FLAO|nr:DUF456 domain-containing protein [Flaviramulus multivorans]MCF7559933.1 DUF456 domain-containing protein [Flaviramulus multivorans]
MDIILIIVAALFMLLGIVGSFLPVLPGPLTSWLGLLIVHFSDTIPMNKSFLIITLIIAILIWVLDYIIPAIGTKRFGGSRYGMVGTSIGLIVGLIAPIPGGIIIGPFFGALIGELINKSDSKTATIAAFGSFIGFLTSTFIKFVVAVIYLGLFIGILWDNKTVLFQF